MASFPDQFDKDQKNSVTRDVSNVIVPSVDAEFLKLVELLDDAKFAVRESASKKIVASADRYEAMIVSIKKTDMSTEVRDRLNRALDEIGKRSLPAEIRCSLTTLKQLGTPEGDKLLQLIADGRDGLRITRLAREVREKGADAIHGVKQK